MQYIFLVFAISWFLLLLVRVIYYRIEDFCHIRGCARFPIFTLLLCANKDICDSCGAVWWKLNIGEDTYVVFMLFKSITHAFDVDFVEGNTLLREFSCCSKVSNNVAANTVEEV